MRKQIKPIVVLTFFALFFATILFTKWGADRAAEAKKAAQKVTPTITTTSSTNSKSKSSLTEEYISRPIIDLSGWQLPTNIDYDAMSNYISGAIIRVQSGMNTKKDNNASDKNGIDKAYKTHIREFQKRDVPVAVYAYVTGKSEEEMRKEAKIFYEASSPFNPTFYWLDVEEKTMPNMDLGVEAFRSELESLGAKNIGIYIGTYFMEDHSISVNKFDAVWMPTYGSDSGYYEALPSTDIDYDLHQYTSRGWSAGISEVVDLNQLSPLKDKMETYKKLFTVPESD
ncbi:glycoside hydrolase family 25 protein [Streptococcus ovuberis]|uniref:Glycosyl hydrolase family 25 n=1 Tax=Streptococcus ovuberis TaxID=1936207 RepID=A0A7X6N1C4_9STRE|nr:glycoside hydrolase family 25 protein [Streptococcus ovuberis]NKZ21236.1 glycosyl hydrolase family 25 [Streptococcus ovuberis]